VNEYEANGRESKILCRYDVVSSICFVSRRLRDTYIDYTIETRNSSKMRLNLGAWFRVLGLGLGVRKRLNS